MLADGPSMRVSENDLELDEIRGNRHVPFPNAFHSLDISVSQKPARNKFEKGRLEGKGFPNIFCRVILGGFGGVRDPNPNNLSHRRHRHDGWNVLVGMLVCPWDNS